MILMIRFPRLTAHVTETFPTKAGHKIASLWPFHSFITPRTQLSILRYPLRIGFLLQHNIAPFNPLIAGARRVVVVLAFEAERFPTYAFYCGHSVVLTFYAVIAVSARAALERPVRICEALANLLLVTLIQFSVIWTIENIFDSFKKDRGSAAHAFQKWIHIV